MAQPGTYLLTVLSGELRSPDAGCIGGSQGQAPADFRPYFSLWCVPGRPREFARVFSVQMEGQAGKLRC